MRGAQKAEADAALARGAALAPVGRSLAARLRDAAEAADRLADFSFDGRWDHAQAPPPTLAPDDEAGAAHDFVLRVLAAVGEPLNFRVLDAARAPDGAALDTLAADLGIARLALIERVHGLIQLGLVARDLQADLVRATPAGVGLAELVAGLGDEVAEWLGKRRRR